MYRNFTLLTLVAALLTLVAAPAAFAVDGASASETSLEAPALSATSKAVADGGSATLIDRILGFIVGVFGNAWTGGESAGSTDTPTDRGPSFDPDNRR